MSDTMMPTSDVLGWASSPEPAEPSPVQAQARPGPDKGLQRAQLGFASDIRSPSLRLKPGL